MPKIRDLQKDDQSALEQLFIQLTSKEVVLDIEGLIENPASHCRVLEEDDAIVGTATLVTYLIPTKGLVGRIEDVVIDESQRGKGLGRVIMEDLIELAKQKGVQALSLTSNPQRIPARRLYESLGFEIYDTGVFWKTLTS
ncbi:GNAT family N-acetyltransferase [Patescibacteria group bacterium]